MVLERHVALGEFVETGVRLEARVTAELLKTIFYPGTSLHDMAAVIRNDRIVAARVQLPLAEADSMRLATEGNPLGTRGGGGTGFASQGGHRHLGRVRCGLRGGQ
jgi:diadenylate cyclase